MAGFLTRCSHCILPILRALDVLICQIWLSLLYPFGLADRPTGYHLVSSYVGKAAANGTRWGARAAAVVDSLFILFGEPPGHCQRAYALWRRLEDIPDELVDPVPQVVEGPVVRNQIHQPRLES